VTVICSPCFGQSQDVFKIPGFGVEVNGVSFSVHHEHIDELFRDQRDHLHHRGPSGLLQNQNVEAIEGSSLKRATKIVVSGQFSFQIAHQEL